MSTNSTPRPQGWKELYARALLETDPAKLSPLIADAHKAILDRIQETLTKPVSAERERLSDALNGLRTLRHEVRVESRRTHQTALAISITPPAN